MEHKSQDAYEELFNVIDRHCSSAGVEADPTVVVTDFEIAAMQAVRAVFGEEVVTKGCFFHLTQATWRKIQELGLASLYKTDPEFKLFCGMMDGLAFVPTNQVVPAMAHLRSIMPSTAFELVKYFDETYVNGTERVTKSGSRNVPPRFPPIIWNVNQATVEGSDRTNNLSEAWNVYLLHLVGHKHPTIWRLIEAMQADHAAASARILRQSVGTLSPRKQTKAVKAYQCRLKKLCDELNNKTRSLEDFLRAVGYGVRLICE